MHTPAAARAIRFGPFQVDARTRELRKRGTRVRVPEQSVRILLALLARAGDVVTRDELAAILWPSETLVDVEHGLNSAVRRLRDALGDSADRPVYIETVPRVGYRFVGSVDTPLAAASADPASTQTAVAEVPRVSDRQAESARGGFVPPRHRRLVVATLVALATMASMLLETYTAPALDRQVGSLRRCWFASRVATSSSNTDRIKPSVQPTAGVLASRRAG